MHLSIFPALHSTRNQVKTVEKYLAWHGRSQRTNKPHSNESKDMVDCAELAFPQNDRLLRRTCQKRQLSFLMFHSTNRLFSTHRALSRKACSVDDHIEQIQSITAKPGPEI
jgi:hypothetical protein